MYNYFDIHTHNPSPSRDVVSIVNVRAPLLPSVDMGLYSYGVHPYDVEAANDKWLGIDFAATRLLAIGEAGLDFRFETTAKLQTLWFSKQLKLASRYDLPVIVHCVKAIPQTLDLLNKAKVERFVFHGYNGSVDNANRIFDAGGYISFGGQLLKSKPLQDIFANIDRSRILLESDDVVDVNIHDIYATAVDIVGESVFDSIEQNFKKLFRYVGNE